MLSTIMPSSNPCTALVTGAATRVGRSIALELARIGIFVWIHYRHSRADAEETLAQIQANGANGALIQADLSVRSELYHLCETIKNQSQRLDLLINNASLFYPQSLAALEDQAWDEMLQVNLTAPMMLIRELLTPLRVAQGLVINLCDIGAERPMNGYVHYSVSKAGLIMLTRALAIELAPQVRVVGISPGQVAWPDKMGEAERDELTKRIPLQRCGSPQDVARLARFLWQEGAYLNGVIIPVDGGLSCQY